MPFDSTNLNFYNDNSWLEVKIYQFLCFLYPYDISAVHKQRKSLLDFIKFFFVYVEFQEIADRLGIEKEFVKRQEKYKRDPHKSITLADLLLLLISVIVAFILALLSALLIFFSYSLINILIPLIPENTTYANLFFNSISLRFLILLIFLIITALIYPVYFFIYYKYLVNFANDINYRYFTSIGRLSFMIIITIIYLLVELNHAQALEDMNLRINILQRMKNLVRLNRLLSIKISNQNTSYQEWITEHFRKIEFFLWERSRWAIVPISSTRETLEKDFRYLLNIYLTGRYGDFVWSGDIPKNFNSENKIEEKSSKDSLLNKIVNFVLAITPLIILLILFIFIETEIIKSKNIPQDVIFFIAISWLLLLIDRILKLGIIDSIVKIAQGIKDLNK